MSCIFKLSFVVRDEVLVEEWNSSPSGFLGLMLLDALQVEEQGCK